jgi:hypothetical protein
MSHRSYSDDGKKEKVGTSGFTFLLLPLHFHFVMLTFDALLYVA